MYIVNPFSLHFQVDLHIRLRGKRNYPSTKLWILADIGGLFLKRITKSKHFLNEQTECVYCWEFQELMRTSNLTTIDSWAIIESDALKYIKYIRRGLPHSKIIRLLDNDLPPKLQLLHAFQEEPNIDRARYMKLAEVSVMMNFGLNFLRP